MATGPSGAPMTIEEAKGIVSTWTNDTAIVYAPNVKKGLSFERYGKYMVAKTMGEALSLGTRRPDLFDDFRRGLLKAAESAQTPAAPAASAVPAVPTLPAAPAQPQEPAPQELAASEQRNDGTELEQGEKTAPTVPAAPAPPQEPAPQEPALQEPAPQGDEKTAPTPIRNQASNDLVELPSTKKRSRSESRPAVGNGGKTAAKQAKPSVEKGLQLLREGVEALRNEASQTPGFAKIFRQQLCEHMLEIVQVAGAKA